ncbi:MAG: protein kinase, partial [Myxococcales bacterium]|nr:protein kinase [Myxococcales bacterium]
MDPTPFGRYQLIELLAQGGMAQVYRAVLRGGPGFEKHVALKRVIRELSQDPEFVARFADEAGIVSTLSHSNIVQVFDFGSVDGEYFLAMELIDGPDLGTVIEAASPQPLPLPVALYIGSAMSRGLGAAHGRVDQDGAAAPVVHRDVSPQNVLVSRAGEVKVVDFGIALAAEKALKTRTGMVLGKCRYMAPEQALGERVDARADVFATGAVLFEMLAGRPLFDGATPQQVIAQVVQGQIQAPSVFNSAVPASVDQICLKALALDRAQRHADCTALARDLERQLHTLAPGTSRDDLSQLLAHLAPRDRPASLPPEEVPTYVTDGASPQPSASASATATPPKGPLSSAFSAAALDAPPTVADPLSAGPSDIPTDPRGPSLDALRAQAPVDAFASTEAVDRIAGLADALTETGSDGRGATVLLDKPKASASQPAAALARTSPQNSRQAASALGSAQTPPPARSGGGGAALVVVLALLLGAGGGIGARLARGPAEPQAETRSAALATAVSHGPWSITVHRVRDNAR